MNWKQLMCEKRPRESTARSVNDLSGIRKNLGRKPVIIPDLPDPFTNDPGMAVVIDRFPLLHGKICKHRCIVNISGFICFDVYFGLFPVPDILFRHHKKREFFISQIDQQKRNRG